MSRGNVSKVNFLKCSQGKWREKVPEGTVGSVIRKVKVEGKPEFEVNELVNDFVEGVIIAIGVHTHEEFGRSWNVTIQDGPEILVLQFKYDSGYAFQFLQKLPNVDLSKPVVFLPYYFEEDRKTRLVLKQDNIKVESYFSREDPHGYPPLGEGADKDDINLWKIQAIKFLKAFLEENIIKKLPKKETVEALIAPQLDPLPSSSGRPDPSNGVHDREREHREHTEPEEKDDLPF